jgi:hypothetical protein
MAKPDEPVDASNRIGSDSELEAQDRIDQIIREEEASETVLELIAGDERRRFVTGSLLVPMLITAVTISVGSCIAANYQDWQDRRTRTRDTIDGVREAATNLSINVEALAQRGSAFERLMSKQMVLEEIRAVDEVLRNLTGRASVLTNNPDLFRGGHRKGDLVPKIEKCRTTVDAFAACLARTLSTPAAAGSDQQPCTNAFRRGIAEENSCKSLESAAYAIIY